MPTDANIPQTSPFENVQAYVSTLQGLFSEPTIGEHWADRCNAALNGEANRELRRIVALEVRRKFGVFFTSTKLSSELLSQCAKFGDDSVFFDPTCGMGDLLLAVAKLLPLGNTLHETLENWGQKLCGTDLHPEFIAGTKVRLGLLAKQRHQANSELADLNLDYFPHIRVANVFDERTSFERATHILMNPPFGTVNASRDCEWGSGRMTAAALFIDTVLKKAPPKTEILAILPDVLRSGTNFTRWRSTVSNFAEIHLVKPFGIFDESADVDVFLLHIIRRPEDVESTVMCWPINKREEVTISDICSVRVGRVVPHRDRREGRLYPYIHARGTLPWVVMTDFPESRRHSGEPFEPPFVVIRRTSRPEQPYRATATVIAGDEPVFVENHLIVCKPNSGGLAACKELMSQLKTDVVNEFLNSRIRCRHLTVSAIRDVPIDEVTK